MELYLKNTKDEKYKHLDFDKCKAASPTDCTGLIQVPPESDEEYESYNEVYKFAPDMDVKHRRDRK